MERRSKKDRVVDAPTRPNSSPGNLGAVKRKIEKDGADGSAEHVLEGKEASDDELEAEYKEGMAMMTVA